MHSYLAAATVRRGGFFTTADIHDSGIDPRVLHRAITKGVVVRLRRSCFAMADALAQLDADARHAVDVAAAVHSLPTPCHPSHRSAAVLHGLPLIARPPRVQLTSATARTRKLPGLHILRAELPALDLAPAVDLPVTVTSVARTVLDLARSCTLEEGVVVADAALHRSLVSREQLAAQAQRQTGWPGLVGARRVLDLADARSESPGESRLRLVLQALGYDPEPQAVVEGATGAGYRVDLRIRGTLVIVEFDGLAKYTGQEGDEVRVAEKKRQDDLGNAGYQIVRITWAQLRQPELIHRLVREALLRAARYAA